MRILLVEDHLQLAESVAQALKGAGWTVDVLHDGMAADLALASEDYALAILDIGLPRLDGFAVLARLRDRGQTLPVLMLTARGEVKDRVHGLNLGADDYLAKPFELSELEARVKALLRRVDAMARNLKMDAGSLITDGLAIDPITRDVSLDGRRLDLTPREFDLLYFFARQPGKVFSRMDLLNAVWGYSHEGYEHTVNTHINRLRAKIESDPAQPVRILTVWGRGYKFAAREEQP